MFTGLVQHIGTITRIDQTPAGRRVQINAADWSHRPSEGESIAVSGVCLTVIADSGLSEGRLAFDVIRETLDRSILGSCETGDPVNLEHAVRADTLMGGHFVQGHVDGMGEVTRVQDAKDDWRVEIRPPADLMAYIAPKGSICVDGVSLTIAAVSDSTFEVALIPTTLEITTLSRLRRGDKCNLEADMLAKQVVHYLRQMSLGQE